MHRNLPRPPLRATPKALRYGRGSLPCTTRISKFLYPRGVEIGREKGVAVGSELTLILGALSRQREYQADLEAVALTDDPAGLARAIELIEIAQKRIASGAFPGAVRIRAPAVVASRSQGPDTGFANWWPRRGRRVRTSASPYRTISRTSGSRGCRLLSEPGAGCHRPDGWVDRRRKLSGAKMMRRPHCQSSSAARPPEIATSGRLKSPPWLRYYCFRGSMAHPIRLLCIIVKILGSLDRRRGQESEMKLLVNGTEHDLDVAPDMPLGFTRFCRALRRLRCAHRWKARAVLSDAGVPPQRRESPRSRASPARWPKRCRRHGSGSTSYNAAIASRVKS